jgi:hypothetical protein
VVEVPVVLVVPVVEVPVVVPVVGDKVVVVSLAQHS